MVHVARIRPSSEVLHLVFTKTKPSFTVGGGGGGGGQVGGGRKGVCAIILGVGRGGERRGEEKGLYV